MSLETLFFASTQGLLILLMAVGMAWTKSVRRDIGEIRKDMATDKSERAVLENRVTNVEHTAEHYGKETDSRLERIGGRVSDLGQDVTRLDNTIRICPACPQPGQGRRNQGLDREEIP